MSWCDAEPVPVVRRIRRELLVAYLLVTGLNLEAQPVVSQEEVETLTDRYVRLASASARLALDEDEAADAVIRPLLAASPC